MEERMRRRLPPYVSYRTFQTFLADLQQGIPSRIDNSYFGNHYSGSTRTQLMSAISFLNLVDINGIPTSRLKLLATSKDTRKAEVLKQTCMEAYAFLFQDSFDCQTGTYAQLKEMFQTNFQISPSVCRKCIKFFVDMANEAGIPLSPYITKQTRNTRTSSSSKSATRKSIIKTGKALPVTNTMEEITERMSWDKMLLNKFPSFDPTWPDEIKAKWFQAFDELLRRGLSKQDF